MNSDLLLRELGERRRPPTDEPPAQLRHRVLTAALTGRDGARRRYRWSVPRLALPVGAFAAALAAVVVGAAIGYPPGPAAPPSSDRASTGTLDAGQILRLAAAQSATAPELTARPDQLLFVDSVSNGHTTLHLNRGPNGENTFTAPTRIRMLVHDWRSVDGTHWGLTRTRLASSGEGDWVSDPRPGCVEGRMVVPDRPGQTETCTPQPALRTDLPTDTDAMQAYLYRAVDGDDDYLDDGLTADQIALRRAATVLGESLHSPAVQAAVFHAVSRIPGVTALPSATDAAGRSGVAVTHTDHGVRMELIFGAGTYRYLGFNTIAVDIGAMERSTRLIIRFPNLRPGDRVAEEAIVRVAVVDQPGQLP